MWERRLGTIGFGFIVHSILYNVQRTEGICPEAVRLDSGIRFPED